MARQKRTLKYLEHLTIENENKIHYDLKDKLYADKHYGYYLLVKISESSNVKNTRKYFYFKYKSEFYISKKNSGYKSFFTKPIKGKSCILDNRMNHKELIFEIISIIFDDIKSEKLTESLLIAIGIVIDILEKKGIVLNSIKYFKTEYQVLVYDTMEKNKIYKNQDKRDVTRLFSEFGILIDTFDLILPKRYGLITERNTLKELTSSMMYQLEYYSLKELAFIKEKVCIYASIVEQKNKILSCQNLLNTLFEEKKQKLNTKRIYHKLLIYKLSIDFNIDANVIFKKSPNKKELLIIEKLKKLSRDGIALFGEERYAVAWVKELFPYYPQNIELNKKYQKITKTLFARKIILQEFGISVEEIDIYLYPGRITTYPLYLLLLIRTGLNSEVLLNWRINKINSKYKLCSDDLGFMIIVEGDKERSNSNVSCILKYDSDEMKFINFYLDWSKEIYNYSKNNRFFQYFNRNSSKEIKVEIFNSKIIGYIKESPKSFFKKYKIFDIENKRVNFIDHRLIRKGHNFQEYLKGKSEFERQINKNHKGNITTKLYYENNSIEWTGLKKHKIARSQNLLVSIFKGNVLRNDSSVLKLFDGTMANCKDNKKPTYLNAINLKEGEFCIDWTKCLTNCEQACVIPKIHGPVIYAWIDYMLKQKGEFIKEDHWEKEYLYDYNAAIDTIKYFTEKEKEFSKKMMNKHHEFVKMVYRKKVKLGKTASA